MLRNFVLFLGAVIAWAIFGAIIAVISAVLVLGSTWNNWSLWIVNTSFIGANLGAFMGLFIGALGLAAADAQRSRDVFTWVVGGSIIGAITGFGTVTIVGDYPTIVWGSPTRSPADLGFLWCAPLGMILGGFSGTVVGVNLWKSRHNPH